MTKEEFDWARHQSPDICLLASLQRNGSLLPAIWDRRWLLAGELVSGSPITQCKCYPGGRIVWLDHWYTMENGNGVKFRLAIGDCAGCGTIYWQSDDVAAAVGP